MIGLSIVGCEKKDPAPETPTDYSYLIEGEWNQVLVIDKVYTPDSVKSRDTTRYVNGQAAIDFKSGDATYKSFKDVQKIRKYSFDGSKLKIYDVPESELSTENYTVTFHYDTMFGMKDTYYSDGKYDYRKETKITWIR